MFSCEELPQRLSPMKAFPGRGRLTCETASGECKARLLWLCREANADEHSGTSPWGRLESSVVAVLTATPYYTYRLVSSEKPFEMVVGGRKGERPLIVSLREKSICIPSCA